jgi:hypothetical protein
MGRLNDNDRGPTTDRTSAHPGPRGSGIRATLSGVRHPADAGVSCYLHQLVAIYASPDFEPGRFLFSLAAGLAETLFLLWLLVKGTNVPQHDERVLVTG